MKDLFDGAIKGYVAAALGDPYTVYYTKEESERNYARN